MYAVRFDWVVKEIFILISSQRRSCLMTLCGFWIIPVRERPRYVAVGEDSPASPITPRNNYRLPNDNKLQLCVCQLDRFAVLQCCRFL